MITNAKNTAIRAEDIETKGEVQQFHFAGSLKYQPQTITASTREEAEEKWLKTRKKIN